jgi:hypothetical protein
MQEGVIWATLLHRGVVPPLFRRGARVGFGRNAAEAVLASLSHSLAN